MRCGHLKSGKESLTQTEARVTVTPSGLKRESLSLTPSPATEPERSRGLSEAGYQRGPSSGACSGGGVGPWEEMLGSSRPVG